MNRREALKRLGISFGVLVTLPSAVTFLQSCSRKPALEWQPNFLTKEEAYILTHIVDVILPPGENSPGASEVNVPEFIDQYIREVVSPDEQEEISAYFKNITAQLKKETGKSDAMDLERADIKPLVARSLEKTKEEEQEIHKKIDNYVTSRQNGTQPELFDDVAAYALITNLRGLAIWSYKTSKTVGEQILAYDPVPGQQQGCVSVQKASGGKAWSL